MWLPQFLREDYSLEKQYLLISKFNLRALGYYPDKDKWAITKIWALFNFVLLAFGCYAEGFYGMSHLNIDVVTALDALCPVATSTTSLFKLCCIWWYREEFRLLIERVWKIIQREMTHKKRKVMQKYFLRSTQLAFWTSFMGFMTATFYSIRPIVLNIIGYFQGKVFIYDTPFHMTLPEVILEMPIYPITYLLLHWHGYVTVAMFSGADAFFLGFCMYFAAILKSIQIDVTALLEDIPVERSCTKAQETEVCEKLRAIIARHNEVADLVAEFSSITSAICLGHFLTSSFVIGSSIVDILLVSGFGVLLYIVYATAVTSELFIYCVGGSAVMDTSQELADVIYCSHWYAYSVRVRKMVLLMIIRSQRSFVVKVPFFSPSLPAFTSILRFTGSLIALAKSVI